MALYYSSARDIWEESTVKVGGGVWHELRAKFEKKNGGAKQFKKEETHPFDAGTSAMIASGELAVANDAPGLFPAYFLRGVERGRLWDSQ